MNLRQLRYFARIVETGNITHAAERLYMAQPALGLQIRLLEQELGVELLHRHSRGVSPTRAGQILYERGCEILRMVGDTERQVTAAGRMQREGIALGLTNGFMNIVGRSLLESAREDLPTVKLSLIEDRSLVLVDALERHELDIALAYEIHDRPGLLRVPLLEEEMLFVTSVAQTPKRLQRRAIEFSELANQVLVLPGQRDGVRQQVLTTAKRLAVDLDVVYDVSSVSMMKRMVVHGDAAAVMPYGNVMDEAQAGHIAVRRIANPPIRRTLYLVTSIRRASFKHEERFLDLMTAICRQFVAALGPLAQPLESLEKPLSVAFAALRSKARTDGRESPQASSGTT